jgi:hypothetical protein
MVKNTMRYCTAFAEAGGLIPAPSVCVSYHSPFGAKLAIRASDHFSVSTVETQGWESWLVVCLRT